MRRQKKETIMQEIQNIEELEPMEEEDMNQDKYLTFKLSDEEYGIEIHYVKEVVGLQRITAIPDMPEYIKGVINMRGQVIPIMDIRARFNMPAAGYNDRTCVVVIHIEGTSLGLIVDEVRDVLDIPAEQIVNTSELQQSEKNRFLQGLGKVDDRLKILLNVHSLLNDDAVEEAAATL